MNKKHKHKYNQVVRLTLKGSMFDTDNCKEYLACDCGKLKTK